ncbi:general substrate transporter [Talaromyces proteolyticus]|uniref:General substrate transporter n=1 Tax=Talaromyces proteolyticus TaxID=1131652 RepID=A0AAD4Q5S0_9EURO|nr:general substrate transporter [Talaromyces proteolyticus]KAH8704848.1 general substrate transporter [Talaromyces proteolyticus]
MAESTPSRNQQFKDQHSHVAHVPPGVANGVASSVEDFMNLVQEANEANERERNMKLLTAFRIYPKAILWSIMLSSTLIMEGYDTSLVGAFNAYPSFLNVFGIKAPDGTLNIPPSWQNGIGAATNCGEVLGLQLAGVMSDRVGYRWTLILALVSLTGFIFIPFYAKTLTVFLVGELFQGISWGVFQTMTTAYAAEVCPVPLRHYLTTFVNLCWIIGQFISAGIIRGLVNRQDVWGYKIPFAVQWVWPIPIGIGIFLAPESPWWCIRNGYTERARNSLRKLTVKNSSYSSRDEDRQIAYMIYTDAMEREVSKGTTYFDCFRGTDLRRSEIVCMTWIAQTLSGTVVGGLSSYFYVRAGISTDDAYSLSWGQTAISAVGTMTSWLVLNRLGRKSLMCGGMVVMFLLLLVAGGMGIPSTPSTATSWTAGTMVLLLSAVADFSVAPVVYTIVSEIPSSRLRAKSIILARNAYNIINLAFVNIISYRQLNASAWNWGPKACFFWAGINLLMNLYLYFRLPETKGRTYAELDILFANHIPARKFSSTKVETIINLDTNPAKVEVTEHREEA